MQSERIAVGGPGGPANPIETAARLRALVPAGHSVENAVGEIIREVRNAGDEALREYTRRFDTGGAEPPALRVGAADIEQAVARLDPDVERGLRTAIENVRRVAAGRLSAAEEVIAFPDHQVRLRAAPVSRAAVYVPGGRAPYPSTVVMGVVTARVAGVAEVAVCAPPGEDGDVHPVVLAACGLTGASVVYRMGGAQAVAALAYGTESVDPVDVIVGPGNLFVQEAKRQVFGQVGIDGFAGPSDLLLLADEGVDPDPLALDLLAQAEHGPGTLVVAVSTSGALLDALAARLDAGPETGAVARFVEVADFAAALSLAEAFAPEHLELAGPGAEALAPEISRAGCLFVGAGSGTAFGDYVAGSNHVLPTGGAARFASGLSPAHFRRTFSEVRIGEAGPLARAGAPVARAEGFEFHARSMEARIGENGQP